MSGYPLTKLGEKGKRIFNEEVFTKPKRKFDSKQRLIREMFIRKTKLCIGLFMYSEK